MTDDRTDKEEREDRGTERKKKSIYNFADSIMTRRSVSLAMFTTHFPHYSLKFPFKLMTQFQRHVDRATLNGNCILNVPTYRISIRFVKNLLAHTHEETG